MTRRPEPRNLALADQVAALLADVWPECLTATQIAERVGGTRPYWVPCFGLRSGDMAECRANIPDWPWDYVHDGDRDVTQWPIDGQYVNPILNRMHRDGQLMKIKVPSLRGVLWKWAGDAESNEATRQDRIDAFIQTLEGGG